MMQVQYIPNDIRFSRVRGTIPPPSFSISSIESELKSPDLAFESFLYNGKSKTCIFKAQV